MMMSDSDIRNAVKDHEIKIDPYDDTRVEPASYDCCVGEQAYSGSLQEKISLRERGVIHIEPGAFALVLSRERITLDNRTAGQFGLQSRYTQHGLLLLAGPQIDPGFSGVLKARLLNMGPKKITLAYEDPFLTVQFFRLNSPASRAYSGASQGQDEITGHDIKELADTEGQTLGAVIKNLALVAMNVDSITKDVGELRVSITKDVSDLRTDLKDTAKDLRSDLKDSVNRVMTAGTVFLAVITILVTVVSLVITLKH